MSLYLITGGSGFIGSHMADELLRRGEKVRVLDNLSTGRKENLAHVSGQIEVCELDIRELDAIRPAFAGVDYVIHLAALPSVPRSVDDPVTSNSINITGTLNVLVAARDAKVKRLVFSASSSAYGDNPEFPRRETQMPRPLSPYALGKLAGEYYCQLFTQLYGLETVALRYFNIFGPRQNHHSPYTGVLSIFITALLRGETPTIFGDGEQSPLNRTVALLNQIMGLNIKPKYGPSRAGDVHDSLADITVARQTLGYEPDFLYEEGLRKTVEWYRQELAAGR